MLVKNMGTQSEFSCHLFSIIQENVCSDVFNVLLEMVI